MMVLMANIYKVLTLCQALVKKKFVFINLFNSHNNPMK